MEWIGTRDQSLTPPSRDSSDGSSGLRFAYFSNEFPKDNLQDLIRRLHVHSKDRRCAILAQFIQEATLAVREEILSLPTALAALVPPFESIFGFAEESTLRSGPLGASIDGVLLCAVQIATLIGYYETGSGDAFDSAYDDTCLAGLGIGLLASIAVSLSPTLKDIVPAGSAVVRLAFRLGITVGEVSENLESTIPSAEGGSSGESWAYVVPDVTVREVQEELDVVHEAEKTSTPNKVFISALSRTSVTISGPPARLKHLSQISDFFRDRRMIALPVFGGLCHAKHIYQDHHVDSVIGNNSLSALDAKVVPRIPIFSTSTGRPFDARTAQDLFQQIIFEILTCAIQWDNVVQGVVQYAKDMGASKCQILVFRASLPIHDLVTAMESESPKIETSTTELIPWVLQPHLRPTGPRGSAESKIAIVGMACRMPGGASDTEKFWELLEQGMDVHRTVPADRFDVDSHYDPEGQRMNTSLTPYGCFIDEPGLFDAPFFNMSPREAQQTDPMQRLALVTAYEALERAGHVANRTPSTHRNRTGTFYGQASDDYREVNSNQEISTYFITGGCRAFGPGRINYYFKFAGPSYSIDTACSSSLATLQTACTSLWNGDTDCAVAGGMNVLTNSDAFAGLSNGHFLSKTPNACKTWDSEADGYCRADGVGSIVMKRLADAEADNDNILGVIVGAGTNHSADAISITHPHAGAQGYLTRQIIRQAGIDPLDVSFVEMHGTGTQAGDMQEIRSVCDVFAPLTRRRSPQQPLHIGAVKANVGHGEAAAGITALLKVLMMFRKEAIPPHVGIKNTINPGFPTDLEKRNLRIPFERTPWPRTKTAKRIAVVNNFSAAGGNSTIAIEEGPIRELIGTDPRSSHLIALSAKSKASLKGNIERLIAYLKKNPDTSLANLGYTTTARRHHYNYRVTAAASSVSTLEKQLTTALDTVEARKPLPASGTPPVVFAFTGQGASHRSTNLQLFHDSSEFRKQILHLDTLSMSQGFPSFIPVIDGSHSQDTVHSPVMTQLALVCTEIALARYWASLGVRPDVVVGHSLGEYAALHVAGVLSANDAVSLVGKRASMLEKKCQVGSHKMVAVRASLADIQASAGSKPYEVACVNGPKDTVLSGTVAEMDAVTLLLQSAGYKCFSLDVAFAFHSSQTDPILEEFEEFASGGILFQPPNLPIISPLLGKVVFDEKSIDATYMCRATRETVNFLPAIETALKTETIDETMVWIEIGPHPVVSGFATSILSNEIVSVPSIRRGEDNWQTLSRSMGILHTAGVELNWNEFHRPFELALRLLDLPTYAWNDKNHWLQYNGDWNLTKGNTYYDAEKAAQMPQPTGLVAAHSSLETSTVQRIIDESFSETAGMVVIQSDLMQADFLAAAWGHQMNGCGVVTSSIHADIAYTLGKYLMGRLKPKAKNIDMNIANLEVLKGLVAHKNTKVPQMIQVSVSIEDVDSGIADLTWHNVSSSGVVDEAFATANIVYGSNADWLTSWIPMTHLVQGRIESLERLANEGIANKLSHSMAYLLFANNLVDYATKYRGMQSVVMHELEAFADVTLTTQSGGTWTIPPYFIDSVAHLAGFVMNVSDANDCKNNFCVTPGWASLRFAKPLVAGAQYRSYVKMIQTAEDPTVYLGDVYVMQDSIIIGMCGGIKFRRYPRVLLDRFFSAPDVKVEPAQSTAKTVDAPVRASKAVQQPPVSKTEPLPTNLPLTKPGPVINQAPVQLPTPVPAEPAPRADVSKSVDLVDGNPDSIVVKAMSLVAEEAQLELTDLEDEASFENLGIDSLMSLVIAEKFRKQLGVVVNGSLFMEYPTVGDLRSWLVEYYS